MATTTTRVSVDTMERLRIAVHKAKGSAGAILPEVDLALQAHADRLLIESETGEIQAPPLPNLTKPFLDALTVPPGAGYNVVLQVQVVAEASLGKTESSEQLARILQHRYVELLAKGMSRPVANKVKAKLEPVLATNYREAIAAIEKPAHKVQFVVLQQTYMGRHGTSNEANTYFKEAVELTKLLHAVRDGRDGRVVVLIVASPTLKGVEKGLREGFILFKGVPDDGVEVQGRPTAAGRAYAEVLLRRVLINRDREAMYEWVGILPGYRPGRVVLAEFPGLQPGRTVSK